MTDQLWVALKLYSLALVGVAQWVEHQPVDQKVVGLIPIQSLCLSCGLSHIDVSMLPFLISFCVKLKVSGNKLSEIGEWRRGNYQEFDVESFSTFFLYHRHWIDSFGGKKYVL